MVSKIGIRISSIRKTKIKIRGTDSIDIFLYFFLFFYRVDNRINFFKIVDRFKVDGFVNKFGRCITKIKTNFTFSGRLAMPAAIPTPTLMRIF